ncbi:uncharacterized protein PHACADRAFT_254906 [Phanerochaete carnosa HHB-10118-sp]|uniref:Uncharacterized protein n=1 Tax=Phanerochaete carnosa (strain HHB-10118-sp) TaxID=650164 RepID=K5X355_PHACS|nr:uncharacterized protein PHACADRAFT_254906 [Phanerochaete carnosa HHB-10118-sp]EKM57242.1 hypothetical protein PHACADRAFT_254906 [Phanerochaete carnosa HHB-10118-sp]
MDVVELRNDAVEVNLVSLFGGSVIVIEIYSEFKVSASYLSRRMIACALQIFCTTLRLSCSHRMSSLCRSTF